MVVKYFNIYHSKALQNFPKFWYFWFENKTIWQSCSSPRFEIKENGFFFTNETFDSESGANPTIVSYSASVVKIYSASVVKIYSASVVKKL
jgi:hypothetical protein